MKFDKITIEITDKDYRLLLKGLDKIANETQHNSPKSSILHDINKLKNKFWQSIQKENKKYL